jgi:nitrite reductase/ring-hydroxylating ferredoxin subunit
MKKVFLIICCLTIFSCGSERVINDCFPGISVNETINLSNPEFIDLQVPNGYTKTNISGRNVLIIRGNSSFKAFDLQCPEKDCTTPMDFDGLIIECVCSGQQYNYLQGGKPQDGEGCFALEYNVTQTSSSSLQITR